MRPSHLAACALASLAAACSVPDYTAVRDWARTASLAADYRSVSAPWAGVTATPAPLPTASEAASAPLAAPTADGLLAMQEALVTYLAALGTLASDGILPFREDPFVQLAIQAASVEDAGGRAVATLGAFLRDATHKNMRAPELRAAIAAADPAVQALVSALSAAVVRSAAGEAEDREAAASYYAQLQRQARDRVARQAAMDLAVLRDGEFAARAAARAQYVAVLARIAEGHALLTARAPRITQEEVIRQVRAAEDGLRRAAAMLPRGPIADPAIPGRRARVLGPPEAPGAGAPSLAGSAMPAAG